MADHRNAHAPISQNDTRALPCRYDPDAGYRVVHSHHREDCAGECAGCQPCAERHCIVCRRTHTEGQTCAGCIDSLRQDLQRMLLTFALRVAALNHPNADIPGGLAQVLIGPYSEGRAALHLALAHGDWTELDDNSLGPRATLGVLAGWEDDWRRTFGHPAGPRATLSRCVDYLNRHLSHAAQRHAAFDEFAADLRRALRVVEAASGDADPTVTGVACFDCGGDLRQTFAPAARCGHPGAPCGCDQGGRRDTWECVRCRRTYTDHDYRRAVRQAHTDAQPWRRAHEVTAVTGIPAGTLRRWAHQGHITARPSGLRQWALYHLGEVRRHAMRGGLIPAAADSANVANASGG